MAVPVSSAALFVRNSQNASVPATVLSSDPARSHQIVQNRESASVPGFTLHFNAVVPAFGFSFYTVSSAEFHKEADSAASANAGAVPALSNIALDGDFLAISNEYLTLSFSRETNLLSFVTDVKRNATISCSQKLMYYEAEGHLLVDMKHKRCVCIFRVFFFDEWYNLIFESAPGLMFSFLETILRSHSRAFPPSLLQVCGFFVSSFDDANRRRFARWSARSEVTVCLVGRNHVSPSARHGTRGHGKIMLDLYTHLALIRWLRRFILSVL